MAASAHHHPSLSAPEHRPSAGVGVGGNCVAQIVHDNCPDLLAAAGAIIEHLDAQAGNWQFSVDNGLTWRSVRTDIINRPGCMGLALDRDARLRVLPFSGHRVSGVRIVFHTVERSHGPSSGSYRPYAQDDRDCGSRSMTLVVGLNAINGMPPEVKVPRPRNKRAQAQSAALARSGAGMGGALAMA
jgi:hypothetical protein